MIETPIYDEMVADSEAGHGNVLFQVKALRDSVAATDARDIYHEVQW